MVLMSYLDIKTHIKKRLIYKSWVEIILNAIFF